MKRNYTYLLSLLIFVVFVIAIFVAFVINSSRELVSCSKDGNSMTITEAVRIASQNCQNLTKNYFCNSNTGTWWIDLNITKSGCSPACVINIENRTAEINWRCTGLIVPDPEALCTNSGGTVTTVSCCLSANDFPNTCLIGACGCSLENSHDVKVCNCGEDKCFDGTGCV